MFHVFTPTCWGQHRSSCPGPLRPPSWSSSWSFAMSHLNSCSLTFGVCEVSHILLKYPWEPMKSNPLLWTLISLPGYLNLFYWAFVDTVIVGLDWTHDLAVFTHSAIKTSQVLLRLSFTSKYPSSVYCVSPILIWGINVWTIKGILHQKFSIA